MSRDAARIVLALGIAALLAGFLVLPQRIPAVSIPLLAVGAALILAAPKKEKRPR